jgi:hypothetical protein
MLNKTKIRKHVREYQQYILSKNLPENAYKLYKVALIKNNKP